MNFTKISLESIIRQHIKLNSPTIKGWETCVHTLCDSGHKGPRAAFRFENEATMFHCFNCGTYTSYNPNYDKKMPEKMQKVLSDFSIAPEIWKQVLFSNLEKQHKKSKKSSPDNIIEPKEITLPKHFYPLTNDLENPWAIVAWDYLKNIRGIDPTSQPFYLSTGIGIGAQKWKGRVIIPIYKDNKLIFWTGRDLTKKAVKKYLNPPVSKENLLYGFDKLNVSDDPLYVVEGWFDAVAIDGVGLLGNEMSKSHVWWLSHSKRRKVYIPDRFGNGAAVAFKALKCGFSISTPNIGQCKDISEAVKKYGKMYVLKSIVENTADGFAAKTNLGIYCKHERERTQKNKSSTTNKKTHS